MALYSFSMEKGARYMAVMLPFMAIAAASFLGYWMLENKGKFFKNAAAVVTLILMVNLCRNAITVSRFKSDYKSSIEYLLAKDPSATVSSTQNWIQNLFMDPKKIIGCPKEYRFFLQLYVNGYRYLVICPQAYISWTEDQKRFTPRLRHYLRFITTQVRPIKVFPHFNQKMLERFVFEHNENLATSIKFLQETEQNHGALRVYDIKECIDTINQRISFQRPARGQEQP